AQKITQESAFAKDKMAFVWDTGVETINEEKGKNDADTMKNVKTGEKSEFKTDGVNIYIGMVTVKKRCKELGIVDEEGYVPSNEDMETSVPGIFAAGDIREKGLRQIVTATGDGSIAAEVAQKYIETSTPVAK